MVTTGNNVNTKACFGGQTFIFSFCRIELYGEVQLKEEETDKSKDEIESAMDAGESKWQFEICDTLTNTGPIIGTDVGQRASNVSALVAIAVGF